MREQNLHRCDELEIRSQNRVGPEVFLSRSTTASAIRQARLHLSTW